MAGYSTKQHSASLKTLVTKIDAIKEDKAKELIYNIVRPIKAMNDEIYGMASDYHGFVDDPASNAVLCQIQSLNTAILEILNRNFAQSPSQPNNSNSKPNGDTDTDAKPSSATSTTEEIMPLAELIRILTPKQYNEDLLSSLLDTNNLTTQNVLRADLKLKVLDTLKQCAFTTDEAEALCAQLAQNLGTPAPSAAAAPSSATTATQAPATDTEDAFGIKVVDLTLTAIDGVFEGEVSVQRAEIGRIYNAHGVDTLQLSSMTEQRFAELLKQCTVRGGAHAAFTKPQCVKVHRAIKTLLNAPQSDRYDIDVAEATLYLLRNDAALKQKQIAVDAQSVRDAFAGSSARRVMEDGKKVFTKKLSRAGNGEIKLGHGTKVWNVLKQWVEDSNAQVPQEVVIPNYTEDVADAGGDDGDDAKEEVEQKEKPNVAGNESLG